VHNLQIRLKGLPSRPNDFELIEAAPPKLNNGTFLARALWLALDPFHVGHGATGNPGFVRPGDLVPARGVGSETLPAIENAPGSYVRVRA